LNLAEKANPKNPRIYLEKGYTYKKIPDYDQAIKSFNRAKEIDPKLTQSVYFDIAVTYLEAEQFGKAEEMFEKTIEVDPKTAIAKSARQTIPNVKAVKRARKPWYLTTSLSWGYDDSIPVDPLETGPPGTIEFTGDGDQSQTFMFRGGYKFINKKNLESGAGYVLSCSGYKEAVANNVLGHIPHLYFQYNKEPVFFRVQYDFSYFYTGGRINDQNDVLFLTFGDSSDRKMMVNSIIPTITIIEPYNLKSDITLAIQRKEYFDDTSSAWNYSGGIVQSYQFPETQYSVRLGYKYSFEDAKDEKSSYKSHEGLVGFSLPIYWGVHGDLSLTHVQTDLKDIPGHLNRSYIFGASLSKPFSQYFLAQFSYNYTHNDSNVTDANDIDPSKFEKNIYAFSLTFNY